MADTGPTGIPDLDDADYQALAAFRKGVRRYLAFAEAGARSVGLTSQQHQAMLAIRAHTAARPMSIGDLAADLLLKHHSTVELVARLEKAGLAQKQADATDRRRVSVSLTGKGVELLASLSANNLRELQHVAPSFAAVVDQVNKLGE